jgi:hypothetical protein
MKNLKVTRRDAVKKIAEENDFETLRDVRSGLLPLK